MTSYKSRAPISQRATISSSIIQEQIMKPSSLHPLRFAMAVGLLSSVSLIAHAGDGPYLGVEGGINFLHNQPALDSSTFDNGWVGGITGGYSFADGWRPELELDYRRNGLASQPRGVSGGGYERSETAMGNLWYDVKTKDGLFSVVHPYLGAGLGYARPTVSHLGAADYNGFDNRFAYQAGAGFGFDLTRNLTASLDYRFLRTDHDNIELAGATGTTRYQAQSAMVGLRYSFGAAPVMVASIAPIPPPVYVPPSPPAYTPPPALVCHPPAGFKVDANCHIIQQSVIVRAVDFEFNSAQLTGPARQTLDDVAAALVAQPELNVEIQGHTDSIGSAAYNLKLSQKRADSVKAYLISKSVNGSNLKTHGFGKTKPIASNDSDEGRTQNRRVEFEVTNAPTGVKVLSEGASAASTDAAQQNPPTKVVKKKHHYKKAPVAATTPSTGNQPAQ
jgi:outer membrane protein OmpA-like peptidoglycan-associated protein